MEQKLQQIADTLLLNGTLVECPGLIHGKMGIAIFFFHYAQYTGNELFEDYAMELIEEIQCQIHANSPVDYERGIAGIGVGMDYLIRNNFLEVNDDFFDDFDQRMYLAVMYDPWQDFSLYDGIVGYGSYWICRMNRQADSRHAHKALEQILSSIRENTRELTEREQTDIICFLCDLSAAPPFTERVATLMKQLKHSRHMESPSINNDPEQYFFLLHVIKSTEMGLRNGYAGLGLCTLNRFGVTNHWMSLL